jgi:hypothetical protein
MGDSHPFMDRIPDPEFVAAIGHLDRGETESLSALLETRPDLAHVTVHPEPSGYFASAQLLDFQPENPIRNGTMPVNAVEVAELLLDSGASPQKPLKLVASGRVAREQGLQVPLIRCYVRYGADPGTAVLAAVGHGEFEALEALESLGAPISVASAAATGRLRVIEASATALDLRYALAFGCQFGQEEAVKLLLQAGVDPNGFNPDGAHAHSTPLHQAALAGHREVVEVLLRAGARADVPDLVFGGTAAGWAEHGGHGELAALIRAHV